MRAAPLLPAALLLSLVAAHPPAASASGSVKPGVPVARVASTIQPSGPAEPWPASAIVTPAALARRLGKKDQPVVLQVGFREQFSDGHVPGAVYAGQGSEAGGLASIRKVARGYPRGREIVLYCGCCPFRGCENLIPAYKLMRKEGFTNLEVLQLENDFQVDWVRKGLPVETGIKALAGGGVAQAAGPTKVGPAASLKRCAGCHDVTGARKMRAGAPLFALYGSRPVKPSIKVARWDAKSLDAFLADPAMVDPTSKMKAIKVRDKKERAAIIAALKALK